MEGGTEWDRWAITEDKRADTDKYKVKDRKMAHKERAKHWVCERQTARQNGFKDILLVHLPVVEMLLEAKFLGSRPSRFLLCSGSPALFILMIDVD